MAVALFAVSPGLVPPAQVRQSQVLAKHPGRDIRMGEHRRGAAGEPLLEAAQPRHGTRQVGTEQAGFQERHHRPDAHAVAEGDEQLHQAAERPAGLPAVAD